MCSMINKVSIFFTLLILKESFAATKCDLKSIFLSPDEIAKRKYDQFQIIERSSFNENVPEANSQPTEQSDISNSLNRNPQSFANAQVLLRIGNEDLTRFKNPNDFTKHLQNYYHPSIFYPPMIPPQLQNGLIPILLNYLLQSQYLSPNPLYFTQPTSPIPMNIQKWPTINLNNNALKTEKTIEPEEFYRIIQESTTEPKNKEDLELVNKVEEHFITRIENKDHPKILQPLDLSNDKIRAEINDDIKENKTKEKNSNNQDFVIEKEKKEKSSSAEKKKKEKETVPTLLNKKSGKLLVTYPINEGQKPANVCKHCQRDPNIAFGKRFPVDVDDLHKFEQMPLIQSNIISEENSFTKRPYFLGNNPQIQSALAPPSQLPMIIPEYNPNLYFSSFRASSGSNSYSDPFKTIIFQHPAQMEYIRSTNVQPSVQPQPQMEVTHVEVPSLYQVIPRYNIIPKYNILPASNIETPGYLWTKMMEMSQENVDGSRSYCPTCARYYKELNE